MPQKITTIIISWNTRDYLRKCLEGVSSFFSAGLNRTIVIDNNSSDASADMVRENFPLVELIENSENVGFAKACNQGMAMADSDIILLLNSDCEISSDRLLSTIIALFEKDESIGIAGPLILYPDGKLQSAGQEFTSLKKLVKHQLLFQAAPIFSRNKGLVDNNNYFNADYVSGSCLFIRTQVLEKIGLFNESFIMYAEDMDLCYRAKQSGFKVVVEPSVSVVHHKSKSTNKNLTQSLRLSTRNNCIFIKKQSGKFHALIALKIYFWGTAMRVILAFFRKGTSPKDWFRLWLHIPFLWKEIVGFED
jgi:O-antigen biosynthesis protein